MRANQKGNFMGIREKLKWADPFTYVDKYLMPVVNPSGNEILSWIIYLVSAFVFAWVIYTALGLALATPAPMVIVVSQSMEPELYRGDVVVLYGVTAQTLNAQEIDLPEKQLNNVYVDSFATLSYTGRGGSYSLSSIIFPGNRTIVLNTEGDTVVYVSNVTGEQIIHRAVLKINAADGTYILTKGDNQNTNITIDQDCGKVVMNQSQKSCITLYPINTDDVLGKAILRIPLLGYIKLLLFDDLPTILFGCKNPRGCILP